MALHYNPHYLPTLIFYGLLRVFNLQNARLDGYLCINVLSC